MPVLTVRRHDKPDLTADMVRPEGDKIAVESRNGTVTVPIADVRAIIAGEPANNDEPATDEGVILA